jgi:hypothetical protein
LVSRLNRSTSSAVDSRSSRASWRIRGFGSSA